jgi:hypothetical protein
MHQFDNLWFSGCWMNKANGRISLLPFQIEPHLRAIRNPLSRKGLQRLIAILNSPKIDTKNSCYRFAIKKFEGATIVHNNSLRYVTNRIFVIVVCASFIPLL